MTERIGQQLGNYRLIRLLGKGGFADTYLGQHIYLKTLAAIKVLQTRLGQPEMDAFHNEARIIARLRHPHIVRVLEFNVENHIPYIIMEYAPNGTLRQRWPRGSILPATTVLTYIKQVAAALHYAHQKKLVHRDVKPENMLLGHDGEVLLSDFGVAIIAQTQAQNLENIAGTVTYMAPEQIQGKPRPASDQYALGITAYEWLCGSAPFGGTYSEIALQHERVAPPPLREQISTLPPEVEQVILTALAKEPQQRFASIADFAAALEEACQNLPVSEHPTIRSGTDPQLYVPTEIAPPPQQPAAESTAVEAEEIPSLDQQMPCSNADSAVQLLQTEQISSAEPLPVSDHENAEPLLLPARPSQQPYPLWSQPHLSNQQSPPILQLVPPGRRAVLNTPWPSSPRDSYALVLLPNSMSNQNGAGQQLLLPGVYTHQSMMKQTSRPPRNNASLGVTLLLFLLSLFIIVGSGLIYFSTTYQSNLLHAQGTAVAGASIMGTAQASATSKAQVAATALSHINMVTATQTAQQNLYTQATSGLPIISDPLSSPDDFGWYNAQRFDSEERNTGNCKFINGAYRSEAFSGYLINCMATETHFSNLAYQVDMTITDGNSGGLIIRADDNGSGYYLRITTNSTYFLEKITSDGYGDFSHTLLASGSSPVIKKGYNRTNQITIIAQGKNLYLYVNKQYVDSVTDASYSSGQIGVYANSTNRQTTVTFRNAQVWKL
ncbi:MAG TPA: protein kinase [Ktedonobacteraceae bacterium]|nr:protein kinase [Ktedonobacteraceae bacterium]